jgi:hypothetical protein
MILIPKLNIDSGPWPEFPLLPFRGGGRFFINEVTSSDPRGQRNVTAQLLLTFIKHSYTFKGILKRECVKLSDLEGHDNTWN